MKTWSSTITYTVFDMGADCETKEDYIEYVKETFKQEHNIYLRDDEITDIQKEESYNE